MIHFGIEVAEGTNISNLSVASGASFPGTPNAGELFYRSDLNQLYLYTTSWNQVSAGAGGDAGTLDGFNSSVSAVANTVVVRDASAGGAFGALSVSGSIIPTTNGTLDIGSETNRFNAIYVDDMFLSTNTLWIGDTPVLGTESDTIVVKADADQSLLIKTSGLGNTTLSSQKSISISTTGTNADIFLHSTGTGSKTRVSSDSEIILTAPTVTFVGAVASGAQTVSGNLTVTGNLTVSGTNTVVNSTTVTTADNIVVLNHGELGQGVTNGFAGIQVDRGELSDYQIVFSESDDLFKVGMIGDLETIASRPWVTSGFTPIAHAGAGATAHSAATTSVNGFMSSADKTKLDGIASGATNYVHPTTDGNLHVPATGTTNNGKVLTAGATAGSLSWVTIPSAPVTSVASKTGDVTLVKGDVGLGNVDDTSDANKPVSTATQTALNLKANVASPTFTGTVSGITSTMVGLGNVDNTSDANKPVSTATQTALNLKANLASPTFTGTVGGITKTMVGLGNVDNTSDASKPVSTATQTALNLKANLASPTLTGTPLSTTASVGTNSTQIATTAFVNAEIANDAAPIAHVGATGSAHGAATTSVNGFMSSTDKTKLDGIATGATANTGTVTSVSVAAANGITGTSSGGATPALTLTLGSITPSSVVVSGTTNATSTTTGSLRSAGGIAAASDIWAGGNVTAYSDARLKTNIERIPNALAKVGQLNGYTYDRTDITSPRQTGVLAQEVLQVLPEAVMGTNDTTYGVAYGNMIGLLIEAIKELHLELNSLKDSIGK